MAVAKSELKTLIIDKLAVVAIFSPALMIAVVFILVYFRILAMTPSMTEYPVRGVDVSHHNGHIDWERVAAQNIRFAYIKATEGNDFRDPLFSQNWSDARRVGLIPGAFHVFGNCSQGVEQARNFLLVWIDRRVTVPPAVDVSSGVACASTKRKPQDELIAFLDEIESATGRRPIVYDSGFEFPGFGSSSINTDTKWVRGIILDPHVFHGKDWIF